MRDIPAYTNSDSLNLSWKLHDLREAAKPVLFAARSGDFNADQLAHLRVTLDLLKEVEGLIAPKATRIDVAA